ncbi:MAG: saccharopine dehydrogenase C-terminal domain-containing protein [Bacteroidota bacterium]
MKRILILGAGMSATSMISYLLDHSEEFGWKVIVGDVDAAIAQQKIRNNKNGEAIQFDVFNEHQRLLEIEKSDVVISMLPARFHPLVANDCVRSSTHMVTASYVSNEMQALHEEAGRKGIALMNELGVDPGIDHMSAMKVIDEIRSKGGKLQLFKSSTGGLVAPEYDNNPWNYKFTWNPRNVVLAGQGVAKFIRNGRYKYIPYHQLFKRLMYTKIEGVGSFEIYPNRDSLSYRDVYGLNDIPTMFRGTMRRPGFCEAWDVFVQLGATDDSYVIDDSENMTLREFINSFLRFDQELSVEEKICSYFDIEPDGNIMRKLKWLGIFENTKIGLRKATPAQILQNLLEKKWALGPGDKDMIVMQHEFEYELNGVKKGVRSSMVVIGKDKENTAMSITVGIPVAIATKFLLTGVISAKGVIRPISPEIYSPILKELESYNISFTDEEYKID